jgi:uncharacterized membrane protein
MLAFSLVGFVASILGYVEYKRSLQGGSFMCSVDESSKLRCSAVYALPQARLFGKIHFSDLAPIYFTAMLLLSLFFTATGSKTVLTVLAGLSIVGVALVPYLVYLELFVAYAICIWCTIMHASIIGMTVVTIKQLLVV